MKSQGDASGRLEVGRVARAHGIQGAVKIALHWSGSDALEKVDRVLLVSPDSGETEYPIESLAAGGQKQLILRLAGVTTRDAAEALRGATVWVPRSALPPLGPGEYFLVDLIGAQVVGPSGPVGQVVEIAVHPSIDCVVLRTPDDQLVEQPLSPHWVARVDVESKRIELSSTDGLIL